jgi:hypothetical protein
MNLESFDAQLFSWKTWREEGPLSMQFSEVVLNVQVGEFAPGTEFPAAFILGDRSVLVLIDKDEKEHAFNLKLAVGDPIDVSEIMPPEAHDGDACDCGHDH